MDCGAECWHIERHWRTPAGVSRKSWSLTPSAELKETRVSSLFRPPRYGESSGRRDGRAVPDYHGLAMSRPACVALAYTVILASVEVE
jgi:hypothetical protein